MLYQLEYGLRPLKTTLYRLPTTNYQLPSNNYKFERSKNPAHEGLKVQCIQSQ